jgi:hypothetical protein
MCPMAPPITEELRFADEIASGDRKRALAAIRDRLIIELAESPTRYVSGLVKVLLDVLRELDGASSDKPGRSIADELVERRQERLMTARGEPPVQRFGGRQREEYPRQRGKPKRSG